jgi:hypothetical protein
VVEAGTIPLVPFAGVTEKPTALQVAIDIGFTAGFGLMVTV